MKRPLIVWGLVILLVFLGGGGLYGGVAMLLDPSGKLLGMDSILPSLLVPNYILPGLFLITVMGLLPILLSIGLIVKPVCPLLERLTKRSKYHWAWTGTVSVGIILLVWLVIQTALIGLRVSIQFITLANGILILLTVLLPSLKEHYRRK